MKIETFFDKFDQLVDGPYAVAKMRGLVLELAVQGKLVSQDPNDEPAIKLLERIQKSKERLIKKRIIRRQETEPISEENMLPHIPQSWAWTRLGDIGDWGSGSTPSRGNNAYYGGGITWLKSGELNDNQSLSGSSETVTDLALSVGSFRRNQPGDVLFAMYGATIGKVAILSDPAVTNQAVCGCTPFEGVQNRYLFTFLLSQRANFHEASEGGAQPNLSKIKIVAFPFPLPPLVEQKRIVAKVDELMAICDRLEAQLKERETKLAALSRASLSRFAESPTPTNLEYIFHKSYSITPADLRKSILTLAVQGKLVPQDPNDEPAINLLERMQTSKERLIKERAIRRQVTDPIGDDIVPFQIPDSWVWTRLGDIGDWGSGSTPARGSYELYGGGITWLKSGELNDNKALSGSSETVTELALRISSFRRNQPGDVLFAMYGATIGKVAILTESAVTNQAVCGCTPFEGVLNRYLFTYLLSQRAAFHEASEGGAQPNLSKVKIVAFPFPLPPFAEQRRIVAKVDQLMALVDQLETQLITSRATATDLMKAVLSELTAT
ncbi:MAG: restriction endonuclease subunit S [Elusimicrobia bacterium]|nr:restriction endonuclease subunit S [Elusimicrobiota bacterium]